MSSLAPDSSPLLRGPDADGSENKRLKISSTETIAVDSDAAMMDVDVEAHAAPCGAATTGDIVTTVTQQENSADVATAISTSSSCSSSQSPISVHPHIRPKRKLRSVFSSNQAIHDLTAKHVAHCSQNDNDDDHENNHNNHDGNGEKDKHENLNLGSNDNDMDLHQNKSEEEIQIMQSNATNPLIDLPHARFSCGLHPFDKNGIENDTNSNAKTCSKCYCFVCDVPASECQEWSGLGMHCHAYDSPEWTMMRKNKHSQSQNSQNSNSGVIVLDGDGDEEDGTTSEGHGNAQNQVARMSNHQRLVQMLREKYGPDHSRNTNTNARVSSSPTPSELEEINAMDSILSSIQGRRNGNGGNNMNTDIGVDGNANTDADMIGQKARRDARITDLLTHNLRQISNLSIAQASTVNRTAVAKTVSSTDANKAKMQGDIPQLNLHKSFFVGGVRIGWPYPVIMQPQRQMAIHLTNAFKNKRHVVLESPTGTGKSAAILCSALAWQRYDQKLSELGEVTKIIYCSRTHSQVAQMVSSLKKTPYRPRMAILGSRDRLCIHKSLRPRNLIDGDGNGNGNGAMFGNRNHQSKNNRYTNINLGCQVRVQNTEKYRKTVINSRYGEYDDENPPTHHAGDGDGNGDSPDNNDGDGSEGEHEEGRSSGRMEGASYKMCPHYRNLGRMSLAKKMHETFVPDRQKVNCCEVGGDKTKLGAHDIEDLCDFGTQPNIQRGVALYRDASAKTFGLQLSQKKGTRQSVVVQGINPCGAAKKEGSIEISDTIVSVNKVDVSGGYTLSEVTSRIRETKDPLVLDVYKGENDTIDVNEYSEEAACPYYLSRALAKDADIIFCPYNYVLDPSIRDALELKTENAVVVLDEAHNVEDTMRQLGSGKFGEIELLEMMVLLSSHASRWVPQNQRLDFGRRREKESLVDKIPEIAHDVLVFIEKLVDRMRESRDRFENNQGLNGVIKATEEYRKFKCPDDKEFEVQYFGPSGSGDGRNPIGCKGFFELLGITKKEMENVEAQGERFNEYMQSKRGTTPQLQRNTTLSDRLNELVKNLCTAYRLSEHYFISTVVSANGNLDFATGSEENNNIFRRFKRKPKPYPLNPKPTINDPHHQPTICIHPSCNKMGRGTVSHDKYCDGSTPQWESHLVLNLLTPGILMAPLLRDCRSVVLASGSLAPLQSLCAELHLLPPEKQSAPDEKKSTGKSKGKETPSDDDIKNKDPLSETSGRLQVTPKPLEANHVVNLPKQLLALGIGHFPDGSPLSVKMSSYSRPGFHDKLGDAIASITESIPSGGVLVFLPSFSFLRKCVSTWQNSSTWERLLASKGEVVVEPTSSSQSEFDRARYNFNNTIETTGKCILLAVFRGKMSEGVSFNDNYARGVICVGVPFPSSYDRSISAKMSYNNEQRKFRKKGLLSGQEWYSQQAYRAIAQAIGRCIRHAADYGTIILLDNRHCDDGHSYNQQGIPRAHANLPKWMRHSVRTLRMDRRPLANEDVLGGWRGLKNEMKSFFHAAGSHCAAVLEKQQKDFDRIKEKASQSQELTFNSKTGKWSSPTRTYVADQNCMSQDPKSC